MECNLEALNRLTKIRSSLIGEAYREGEAPAVGYAMLLQDKQVGLHGLLLSQGGLREFLGNLVTVTLEDQRLLCVKEV